MKRERSEHVTDETELSEFESLTAPDVILDASAKKENPRENEIRNSTTCKGIWLTRKCTRCSTYMKWKSDSKFRRDFLHTVAILFGFMASGFLAGQTGPTFLDLSEIAQEDLSTASWLHPSCSLACVFSSLLFGFLSERYSRDLLMATSLTGAGVFALIRPWCTVLLAMIAAHALACFCICGMETVGNAFIMSLWGKDGAPYMQMVHFAFALGGIIAPVVTAPFLSSQRHVYNTNTTMAPYVTTGNQEDEFELYNHSYINVNVSSSHDMLEGTGTRIHFAYLIGTILDILCAMPFFGVYIMQTKTMKQEDKKNKTLRGIRRHKGTLKFRQKMVMMLFLAIICHLYLAVEKNVFHLSHDVLHTSFPLE